MNNLTYLALYFLSATLINIFCVYFSCSVINKKISWNSLKNITIIITMTIIGVVLNLTCQPLIKFISSFLIIIFFVSMISKNIKKICITVILLELVMAISEMIIMMIINVLKIDYQNTIIVTPISNIIVVIIGTIILKTNIMRKIIQIINEPIKFIQQKEIINYSIFILMIISISTIETYMQLPILVVLVTNTLMSLILIFIIIKFVTTKGKYEKISNKYQTSTSSLKEYENMIEKYRIYTHENKNELLTIRNMSKNNKKIVEYIDKLIDNKIKDNENIMKKTSKIPEGGLRATIYSKMCLMDEYQIKYKLDISREIKTVDIINMNEELIINICKILGVFLDNAIEHVKKLKERNIYIELYTIDDSLYIDITNNYENNINIEKLGKTIYTTKGENRGYGLLLVNRIIKDNKNKLKNERRITDSLFTQSLEVKIK